MKCKYDTMGWRGCLECEFADCVRNDIKSDEKSERVYGEHLTRRQLYSDSYKRSDERWQRKIHGLPVEPIEYKRKGREAEYQREYRARMSEEQKETYRKWQREYARRKRAKVG